MYLFFENIVFVFFSLLQQLKEAPLKTNGHAMVSSKIIMAFDAIQAIKLLRREVVDAMKTLLSLAKDKQTAGMMPICNDMISKVIKCICNIYTNTITKVNKSDYKIICK